MAAARVWVARKATVYPSAMPGIWRKTLIYLGLVEDEEFDEYYDDAEPEQQQQQQSARPPRRQSDPDAPAGRRDAVVRALPTQPAAKLHLVFPRSFNDAQEVGDKYRDGYSVLLNLQAADGSLAQRIVDFAAGLTYGFRGQIQPVAERVYLLVPPGVEVSAEERRRFLEESGFFNQA